MALILSKKKECRDRITSNQTDIQNQSDHQQRNAKQDQVMDSIAPVMDSIAPSASRLDPVNLPSSYEEAVKMTNRDMTISPKKLNPIQVTLDSGISVRRGFIYKANKSPIIIYKFIELFLQLFHWQHYAAGNRYSPSLLLSIQK